MNGNKCCKRGQKKHYKKSVLDVMSKITSHQSDPLENLLSYLWKSKNGKTCSYVLMATVQV